MQSKHLVMVHFINKRLVIYIFNTIHSINPFIPTLVFTWCAICATSGDAYGFVRLPPTITVMNATLITAVVRTFSNTVVIVGYEKKGGTMRHLLVCTYYTPNL